MHLGKRSETAAKRGVSGRLTRGELELQLIGLIGKDLGQRHAGAGGEDLEAQQMTIGAVAVRRFAHVSHARFRRQFQLIESLRIPLLQHSKISDDANDDEQHHCYEPLARPASNVLHPYQCRPSTRKIFSNHWCKCEPFRYVHTKIEQYLNM
jgi:hypothetical protein